MFGQARLHANEFENEYEGEFENEYEGEFEGEYEDEFEGEYMSSPPRGGRVNRGGRQNNRGGRQNNRGRARTPRPNINSSRTPTLSPPGTSSTSPGGTVRATSPGGTVRATSPGGTAYRRRSPSGRKSNKSRREAAGYKNPGHFHSNMLPHWRKAAVSPPPPGMSQAQEKRYLKDSNRRYRGTSPGRSRTTIFQGHQQGVLGHEPSASTHWNMTGHQQTRKDNLQHNRQTSTYQGIEYRPWSDQSGSREPRYRSPAPDRGSHPSYWNRNHPNFQGGPWHSWEVDKTSSPTSPPAKKRKLKL